MKTPAYTLGLNLRWCVLLAPLCFAGCGSGAVQGGTNGRCGDGIVGGTEECDDSGESTTCDSDCTAATCGDNRVNTTAGEDCDRGGVDTSTCNYDCTATVCGDGYVNPVAGETCDQGGETSTCNGNCTAATCGDGFLNTAAGETCDGGGIDTATCNTDCTAAACGDNYLNTAAAETCDDGAETLTCDSDCTAVACGDGTVNTAAGEDCDDAGESASCNSDCTTATCGDSVVNVTAAEECDTGAARSDVTPDACRLNCMDAGCGDGVIDTGEDCDDAGPSVNCNPNCTTPGCGDGIINPATGEICDDGLQNSDTAPSACRTDCTPARCGDGIGDYGESCDDGNTSGGDSCPATCIEFAPLQLTTISGSWVDVALSPSAPDTVYAETIAGEIYMSTDAGGSWALQCVVPGSVFSTESLLVVSPAADATAYVVNGTVSGRAFRIVAGGGADCIALFDTTVQMLPSHGGASSFTVAPASGDLYAWAVPTFNTDYFGRLLHSGDRGTSWQRVYAGMASVASTGYVTIDPADDGHILIVRSPNAGVYRRGPGETELSLVTSSVSDATVSLKFDPARADVIYSNNGFRSTNNGANWTTSTGAVASPDWALTAAGEGYRLVPPITGTDTTLDVSVDMLVWSAVPGASFPGAGTSDRIDAAGSNIAVVVSGELYISTDAGISFATAFTPPTQPTPGPGINLSSIDSSDGRMIYGTTSDWSILRSSDGGSTWEVRSGPPSNPGSQGEAVVRMLPAAPNSIVVFPKRFSGSAYDSAWIVSHDGGATVDDTTPGQSSWGADVAVSPTDPSIVYYLGFDSLYSTNAGDTLLALSPDPFDNVWDPTPGFVHPTDSMTLWIVDARNNTLYEYTRGTGRTSLNTLVTAALNNEAPAGLDQVEDAANPGQYLLRVVSPSGYLAESNDNGASFTALGPASALSTQCDWRYLRSKPDDPNIIVTACVENHLGAAISGDGGATWIEITEPAWNSYACNVSGLVITNSTIMFACRNTDAIGIPYSPTACGNGVVDLGETCDDGLSNSDTVADACRTDCTLAGCGDGIIDSGEECDDTNTNDNDGCTSACTDCGNTIITAPETCDAGGANSNAPDATCRTNCQPQRCGDGVQDSGETCDDGNTVGGDGCRGDCNGFEACGDTLIDYDAGEGCDDGGLNDDTLADACRTSCLPARCGDGVLDSGEQCDDANTNMDDECSAACEFISVPECAVSAAGLCLDGIGTAAEIIATSTTWPHTVTAAVPNRLLIVAVGNKMAVAVTDVTYGAVPLTLLGAATASSGAEHAELWYLIDPPTGTNDVIASIASSTEVVGGSLSFANAMQAAPSAPVDATTRDTMPIVTVPAPGPRLVVDVLVKNARHDIEPDLRQRLHWDFEGPGYSRFASSSKWVTADTQMRWAFRCCSDNWTLSATLIEEAP